MLDKRRIDGLVIEKLDDPLLAGDVDERLGLGAAERAATAGNDLGFQRTYRLRGLDPGRDLTELLRIAESRKRTRGSATP